MVRLRDSWRFNLSSAPTVGNPCRPLQAESVSVELYGRVRHACQVEGLSQREAARRFGLHRKTVRKMLAFSVPPGYRRSKPPARPKLDPFTPIIDRILETDRSAPPK